MPAGYANEGKTFSRTLGKWVTKEKEKRYDYDLLSEEQRKSAILIVSFFRWYPDLFYDLIRSPTAKYKLELPQRMILRLNARYRNVYITGSRGLTKTFCLMLSKCHDGEFFPGEKIRYVAPAQKQSAKLASDAFSAMEENYPLMASWWAKRADRNDMFRITTMYGSEFTMYAPRGDNCSAIVGEEIGQEGEEGFNIDAFESDISPTCRLTRKVNGVDDRVHINLKETYITNASSKQNKAFTTYRKNALDDMIYGDSRDGFCADIPWQVALLCNLRDIAYYKKERKKLTAKKWSREMDSVYTGEGDNPLIADELIAKSKRLMIMEDHHCGKENCIYVVAHDVSYAGGNKNARCADVVLKLTEYNTVQKRDKYKKQVVYVDYYQPPKTHYEQAQKVKRLWSRYCKNGAEATYLVVDAQSNGTVIAEELMKPSIDGLPNLRCYNNIRFAELAQLDALPVIYPIKAGTRGTADEDGAMIKYAQREFEQGNIELLTSSLLDGVEAYKAFHDIKDDTSIGKIAHPYKQTEILCKEIANLREKTSGFTTKEERKSMMIQRDGWSALKYALRMAAILEENMAKDNYRSKSSLEDDMKKYLQGYGVNQAIGNEKDIRSRLLSLRRARR